MQNGDGNQIFIIAGNSRIGAKITVAVLFKDCKIGDEGQSASLYILTGIDLGIFFVYIRRAVFGLNEG